MPNNPTNERVIAARHSKEIPRVGWFSGELGAAGQGVSPQVWLAVEFGDAELNALVLSRTRRIGIVRRGLRFAEANRQQAARVDAVGEQPLLDRGRTLPGERQALLGRARVVGVALDPEARHARILVQVLLELGERRFTAGAGLEGGVIGLKEDATWQLQLGALHLDVGLLRRGSCFRRWRLGGWRFRGGSGLAGRRIRGRLGLAAGMH